MNKETNLNILRHSASHVMAAAVKKIFPAAKLAIGPATQEGFYYDFDLDQSFTDDDLKRIEKEMKQIIKRDESFTRTEMSRAEAIAFFAERGDTYKVELLNEITDETVSLYQTGEEFIDLCRGPHVSSAGQIKAFKLTSVAGAYWRGDERNKMLQRIYGTAFPTKEELTHYLEMIEEAKRRDHRKIGPQQGYFSFHEKIGPGLVLYHPKGALLRSLISGYLKEEHARRGYGLVEGPHILKSDIWIQSGHYEHYKELMFIFEIDGTEYGVKPMNCPGHMLVYQAQTRSYRDLPLRLFELGNVYRYEKSGVLHGLLRVRGFTQDDAHIFCLPEQLQEEIQEVLDFAIEMLGVFGFQEYKVELSTRPQDSIGTDEDWLRATDALEAALKTKNIPYERMEGEGAFYGPKIDVKLKDALGRLWQCSTVQCDFALPERFELTYIGEDGKEHRPVIVHRALLGSLERFMGALIEHHAGAFPVWLSPAQVVVIPIADRHQEYARGIKQQLDAQCLRAQVDERNETMQAKIRDAQADKMPYMLIVGDKEAEANSVSVRYRSVSNERAVQKNGVALREFIEEIQTAIREKK